MHCIFDSCCSQTIEKKTQFISFETIKKEDLELLRFDHYRVEGISHFKVCIHAQTGKCKTDMKN